MGDKRTILILGAGIMQQPAIRAARRMGLRVIAADANDSAPGVDEADIFEHIDLRDRISMLEAARRYHQRGELDAVFTAGTDFSATVAYVAESLGLPGTSYQSALNATDKYRMREVLRDAGVRVPQFAVIEAAALSNGSVRDAVAKIGLPVVVKPADSMGARGVVRADSADEAFLLSELALSHSASRRVVIEGYIDGPEFSIDAIVFDGGVQITGFADRHISFPPYFIEMGHTIPGSVDPDDRERIAGEFARGIAALGISNGAAKGDMKLSRDGPVVGEIAARLSGGFMSGWTFPLSSGVELTERAIRIALGEPPGTLTPRWERTSAERAVISIPGTVRMTTGAETVRRRDEIAALFISAVPGSDARLPTNNVEKSGNVIAVADDRGVATRAAEAGVAGIEVVLEPENRSTNDFLFGEPGRYWAFGPGSFDRRWLNRIKLDSDRSVVFEPGLIAEAGAAWRGAGPVGIGPLPPGSEIRDWAWRSLADTVGVLSAEGLVSTDRFDERLAPLVWRAVLRGGLQGGRYVLGGRE